MKGRSIRLPPDVIKRCIEYGEQFVESYREGNNPWSRAVSSHGAEHNPVLQANAKMAECAFCLLLGLSIDDLYWDDSDAHHHDVLFHSLRVDVKHTSSRGRFLIWPIRKIAHLPNKKIDVLVLVRGDRPQCDFEISGWVGKRRFIAEHRLSDENDPLPTVGTPCMELEDLWSAEDLFALDPLVAMKKRLTQWLVSTEKTAVGD